MTNPTDAAPDWTKRDDLAMLFVRLLYPARFAETDVHKARTVLLKDAYDMADAFLAYRRENRGP